MAWSIDLRVADILRKAQDGDGLTREEAVALLRPDVSSQEVYALMHAAQRMSREMRYQSWVARAG